MRHFTGASSIELESWFHRQWQTLTPWQALLFPLSIVYAALVFLRRLAYRYGLLKSYRLPVPVIVVGNMTVGGTGKTPLVIWLVEFLRQQGYRPGVISRGYGGRARAPQSVTSNSDPFLVGDEPVLMAQRAQCPVWVGANRVRVARALLSARPDCNVLISDDGLQHYRLRRDFEIVVVDGHQRFGNGLMLPAGPLREPGSRLERADAVVINGGKAAPGEYAMQLLGDTFQRVINRQQFATVKEFSGKTLHAVAGIGQPARFFRHLRQMGLDISEHPFPDHHSFQPHELQFENSDAILMTEKDAVKCTGFASELYWVLSVQAQLDFDFGPMILEKLRKPDGRKAA